MSRKEEQLNNEKAPEKKKFMKSVASWFVEEEEDEPVQESPAEEPYEAHEYETPAEDAASADHTQPVAAAGGPPVPERRFPPYGLFPFPP